MKREPGGAAPKPDDVPTGRPADAERSMAQGERDPARQPPDPSDLSQRAAALRKRIAALAGDLARTEEQVAMVHDQIAASRSGDSDQYWLAAAEARKAALRAREIERRYRGGKAPGPDRHSAKDPRPDE